MAGFPRLPVLKNGAQPGFKIKLRRKADASPQDVRVRQDERRFAFSFGKRAKLQQFRPAGQFGQCLYKVAHPQGLAGTDVDRPDVIARQDCGETARDVVRRYGLTFPVIHDASNVLAGRFRVSTMPSTFVADPSGTIRWIGAEGQTEQDLRQAVQAARAAPRGS